MFAEKVIIWRLKSLFTMSCKFTYMIVSVTAISFQKKTHVSRYCRVLFSSDSLSFQHACVSVLLMFLNSRDASECSHGPFVSLLALIKGSWLFDKGKLKLCQN